MNNDLAICLFTSAKGHFGIKTRYLETIKSLRDDHNLDRYRRFAHIKYSESDVDVLAEMENRLDEFGYEVDATQSAWKHGELSHQVEYLSDMFKIFNNPAVLKYKYALFMEDDMIIRSVHGFFSSYLSLATALLEKNPNIVSVRVARAHNERERIIGLKGRYGINSVVKDSELPNRFFYSNDFSNNPHICRTRDMRNAIIMMKKNPQAFMQHSEMGLGPALKYFSQEDESIAILNPDLIYARHIGTPAGEEENLFEPLFMQP